MTRWHPAQQGLKSLFLVAFLLLGCSATGIDDPQEGCGGTEASVSCLRISNIVPTAITGPTSNVDAFAHQCRDPVMGTITGAESLRDHSADVTFTNTQFLTARGGFDIRVIGYSISYVLQQCPATARGCPPLPGFTSSETFIVTNGGSVTRSLPFVPLSVKQAYVAAGGELGGSPPTYSASYLVTAQTVGLSDTFTVEARSAFTIADFDTCQ